MVDMKSGAVEGKVPSNIKNLKLLTCGYEVEEVKSN